MISLVSRNRVETAVLGCWVLTLVVICLHAGISPGRHSVFTNYRDAGGRWIAANISTSILTVNSFFTAHLQQLCLLLSRSYRKLSAAFSGV